MSYSLIAYAVPAYGFFRTLAHILPTSVYTKYEEAPKSPHTEVVEQAVLRALTVENLLGTRYKERITEMLSELPAEVKCKDIMALFSHRFKVSSLNDAYGISATGTDVDALGRKGMYYIGINPKAEQELIDAIPWFSTHEVCHILEGDWVEIGFVKAVASLVATFATTYWLGWALVPAIGGALLTNMVTYSIMSRRAENRADCFANEHCTRAEKLKAILYFESKKQVTSYAKRFFGLLSHPSTEERIANIKKTLF